MEDLPGGANRSRRPPHPPSRKHATIYEAFPGLATGAHLVLDNDHDPLPSRRQFDVDFARVFTWEYEEAGPHTWRAKITRTASTALPQVLTNTIDLAHYLHESDLTGAIWKIPLTERDLDANVITLAPRGVIASHAGPDIDVRHVIIGGDELVVTEIDELAVHTGDVLWLPKRSRREIRTGGAGMRDLTVQLRKTGLGITTTA